MSFLPRLRRGPELRHTAKVHDVRAFDDDRRSTPYYVAICDCDWIGTVRKTAEEAFDDLHEHELDAGLT